MSASAPLPDWLARFQARLGAELIETHISWVLLTDGFVWKLKKPLSLPFLDYGTAEQRRFCCHEELRLNRRLAPGLYLGLEEVDDSGECAVKMRRFAESQRLDHVCDRGGLGPDALDSLARTLHAFHRGAAVADARSPWGEPAEVLAPALDNFTTLLTLPLADAAPSGLLPLEPLAGTAGTAGASLGRAALLPFAALADLPQPQAPRADGDGSMDSIDDDIDAVDAIDDELLPIFSERNSPFGGSF